MSKHTKGPWHYSGDSLTHKAFQIYSPYGGAGGRQTHICTTNDLPHSVLVERDANEAEANARLIAAAPELLEACKAALKALDEYQPNCFENSQIRKALAKAEGGAK